MTLFDFAEPACTPSSDSLHAALQSMDPISLPEMDGVALMNRVDSKYVFNDDCLTRLLERIANDYRVLEIDGDRDFSYESLYYDTPRLDCYLTHHNGKVNRRKFRLRKYVSSGKSFLEIKKKNGKGRTDKRRMSIDDIDDTLHPEQREFIQQQIGELPNLRPSIWTLFSRVTLVNRRKAERVTIDRQLAFDDGKVRRQLPGLVIAEIKQERDDRSSPVRVCLRDLKVRPMRLSKYCLGSMLLTPGLKYNRFKKKLLAIKKIV